MAGGMLEGIRVIDLTSVVVGPLCTQILADHGAQVTKVESPQGDIGRYLGGRGRHVGMAPKFLHLNRNKRSICLDLKHPAGHAALLRLLADADVLVWNVRPDSMARLNLSYDDVRAVNPRLVYCGMFGFGQRGRYAGIAAYDPIIQGASGVAGLHEKAFGTPRYVPYVMADRTCGLIAVQMIVMALFHRERTGEGQSIEVPMFETMVPFVLGEHMGGQTFEPPLGPAGYPRQLARERTPFPTRDGHVCALIYNDKHWRSFYAMIGDPGGFERDPRMVDIDTRTRHIGELYAWVAEVLRSRTTAEWLSLLEQADIPAMPLHTLESLPRDPHLNAVGLFPTIDHPTEGRVRQIAPAGTWSQTPPSIRRPAPRLGEHSVEVLAEHGYSAADIERLLALGVTRQAPPAA